MRIIFVMAIQCKSAVGPLCVAAHSHLKEKVSNSDDQ